MNVRIIIEPEPRSGSWNMAVDEALLEAAVARGQCTVRWYRWSEATVSLGYFQDPAELESDPRLAPLPKVRRLTGGGAIVHHHEWTYSCALPAGYGLARSRDRLYEESHRALADVLRRSGFPVQLRGDADPSREGRFLCFARGDSRDLVLQGHKVLGSAQRRRRGAVLQHGSLILRASPHTPGFPGLLDLVPEAELNGGAVEQLAVALAELFGERPVVGGLSHEDRQRAGALRRERYRTIRRRRAERERRHGPRHRRGAEPRR